MQIKMNSKLFVDYFVLCFTNKVKYYKIIERDNKLMTASNGVLNMRYLFLYYPKCSTCIKAKKFLENSKIDFLLRDISVDNPNLDELKQWYSRSGLPLKCFFNTNGAVYREMNLKEKIGTMSEGEQLELLSQNGMLVKRPLLISEEKVIIGFKENEWKKLL